MRSLFLFLGFVLSLGWGLNSGQATENQGLVKLIELINQERKTQGKLPLEKNPALMGVAWEWSYRIAQEKRLTHRKNMLELCEKYHYQFMNENLHLNLSEFDPEKVVQSWMASVSHRRNLLEDRITLLGVGYSQADDGSIFVVFNGAAPARE
jgi:uncharacterized protein YkwD